MSSTIDWYDCPLCGEQVTSEQDNRTCEIYVHCSNPNCNYGKEKTFECGTPEHYQEYLESRKPFPNETPLTYAQFIESIIADGNE